MDYLEFIARVTSHIPDKGQVSLEGELTSHFQRSLCSLPPLLGLRPGTKGSYPLGSPRRLYQTKAVKIRYYGLYSNAHRGKIRKAGRR